MSIAPCPYCDEMPEIQLKKPKDREFWLSCEQCGLEMGDRKRSKAIHEWNKNYRTIKQYEEIV